MSDLDKRSVHDFWSRSACGETLYLSESDRDGYRFQAAERYRLEPWIQAFADFESFRGKRVLEVGVGLGADHQLFAAAGAELYGIDLTERAVGHTSRRLEIFGLSSRLAVGDAENIAFPDNFFDGVYSYGVLHHTPDTARAVNEVWRVLKPGGVAKIMIYHKWSLVGLMLWVRYALLVGRPFRSLCDLYAEHLESPGTKAYSTFEARKLFSKFADVLISTGLGHGDLLESEAGQRHRGILLSIARKVWPRWFIRRFLPNAGLLMLIEARKQ